MNDRQELNPGDIVQMHPDCTNPLFAHNLMIVDEVKPWGIKGHFHVNGSPGETIPYREENGKFTSVGKTVWMLII